MLIRQDWEYEWQVADGEMPWEHWQQTLYHNRMDQLIWWCWSLRARLRLIHARVNSDASLLAQRFPQGVSTTFDIRRVKAGGQWHAVVTKVVSEKRPLDRAQVWFDTRVLHLYSVDIMPHRASRFPGDPRRQSRFFTTPHEFGHALGQIDERNEDSPFYGDVKSIMNIGRQIRPRHLSLVCRTVASMLPGCRVVAVMER